MKKSSELLRKTKKDKEIIKKHVEKYYNINIIHQRRGKYAQYSLDKN